MNSGYKYLSKYGRHELLEKENKLFLKSKRSKYSNKDAIKNISQFGISDVIEVGKSYYIQEFIKFQDINLTIKELANILQKIHSIRKGNLTLVHGDFSNYNTTKINNRYFIFDYGHVHYGNSFVDIGRIILRETNGLADINLFFNNYSRIKPDEQALKKGLSEFCIWQHKIRREKYAHFSEVPLIRKERIERTDLNFEKIINSFKKSVSLEEIINHEITKYDNLFLHNEKYNSNPNHERFSIAQHYLFKINPKKVLDVGVGRGHFFHKISEYGYDIWGIEPSDNARKINKNPRIVRGYCHQIPFSDNDFDLTVCLDVLEHIPSFLIECSLMELHRTTKKYSIISVASHSDIVENVDLHISAKPFYMWKEDLKKYFQIISSKTVVSKADAKKTSKVYLLGKI